MKNKKKKTLPNKKQIKARLEAKDKIRLDAADKGIHPDHFWSLGIIVDNLGVSEQSIRLIRSANEFIKNNIGIDLIIYCESYQNICINPMFTALPMYDITNHNGPLIATNNSTLLSILSVHNHDKKYLYITNPQTLFSLKNTYNPNIDYIVAGEDYAQIFKKITGVKPLDVIPRFNVPKLIKCTGPGRKIHGTKTSIGR